MSGSTLQSSPGLLEQFKQAPLLWKAYFGFAIAMSVFYLVFVHGNDRHVLAGWTALPYVLSTIFLLCRMPRRELLMAARLLLAIAILWGLIGVATGFASQDVAQFFRLWWLDLASILIACLWFVALSTRPVKAWAASEKHLSRTVPAE